MKLLGDLSLVEPHSVRLEMVLALVQDRCTVCAKRTRGSDIVLDAPDGTPWLCGTCRMSFGPFGDSVSVTTR